MSCRPNPTTPELIGETRPRREPGAAFVLDALGFDDRMRASRAVVVGEGRLDRTTLAGKAAGERLAGLL